MYLFSSLCLLFDTWYKCRQSTPPKHILLIPSYLLYFRDFVFGCFEEGVVRYIGECLGMGFWYWQSFNFLGWDSEELSSLYIIHKISAAHPIYKSAQSKVHWVVAKQGRIVFAYTMHLHFGLWSLPNDCMPIDRIVHRFRKWTFIS